MSPSSALVHVIDDDEAVRASLAFLLETAGFSCRTWDSAFAFLNSGETASSDCIVTDVRMPGMTGLQLVAELKARAVTTPVIVITGHGDVPMAVEALKRGVADFLEKPFDDEALLAAIHDALKKAANSAPSQGGAVTTLPRTAPPGQSAPVGPRITTQPGEVPTSVMQISLM